MPRAEWLAARVREQVRAQVRPWGQESGKVIQVALRAGVVSRVVSRAWPQVLGRTWERVGARTRQEIEHRVEELCRDAG